VRGTRVAERIFGRVSAGADGDDETRAGAHTAVGIRLGVADDGEGVDRRDAGADRREQVQVRRGSAAARVSGRQDDLDEVFPPQAREQRVNRRARETGRQDDRATVALQSADRVFGAGQGGRALGDEFVQSGLEQPVELVRGVFIDEPPEDLDLGLAHRRDDMRDRGVAVERRRGGQTIPRARERADDEAVVGDRRSGHVEHDGFDAGHSFLLRGGCGLSATSRR